MPGLTLPHLKNKSVHMKTSVIIILGAALASGGCSNITAKDVLIGTAVVGTVAAAGYYANKQSKKQREQEQQPRMLVAAGGRCLDLAGGANANAPLQLWDCHGRENQRFRLDNGQLKSGNLCLDVAGADPRRGARVIAYTCHNGRNQQWEWANGQLRSKLNKRCLDAEGGNTRNGTRLLLWDCHGGANQQFIWRA